MRRLLGLLPDRRADGLWAPQTLHDDPRRHEGGGPFVQHAVELHELLPLRGALVNDIGVEAIEKRVVNPLTGLKVAGYVGCQTVRPFAATQAGGEYDCYDDPTFLDDFTKACGTEAVAFERLMRKKDVNRRRKGPPIGMEKGPLLIIGSGSSPE